MKKVLLKNLEAYSLSAEEKKNVVGGDKSKLECMPGPGYCECELALHRNIPEECRIKLW